MYQMVLLHWNVWVTILFPGHPYIEQGQKLLKKESDVGMLLIGKQSTETSCM